MAFTRIHYTIAGLACLFFGLLLPIASVPILGSVNLLSISLFMSFLTIIAIALAALFLFVTVDRLIADIGIALFVIYLSGAVIFEIRITIAQRQLADSLKGNAFAGLANAAATSIHLDYGIAVLLIGSALLIVPVFLRNQPHPVISRGEQLRIFQAFVSSSFASHRLIAVAAVSVMTLGLLGSGYLDVSDRLAIAGSPSNAQSVSDTSPVTSAGTSREQTASEASAPAANELAKYVSVQPLDKHYVPADTANGSFENQMQLTLQYHNLGAKKISAVKGVLTFTNQFGDRIQGYNIEYEVPLTPGAISSEQSYYSYNQFEDEDTIMRDTPFTHMRFRWKPTSIIFADGTRLNDSQ